MKIDISMFLVFIGFVLAHILEERIKDLRYFFNIKWFKTGDRNFPITRFEALWKDQVGLFFLLAAMAYLAYIGKFGGITILIAVGFVTADTIQHTVFSIARRSYTPGIATSVLYMGYVLNFYLVEVKLAAQDLGMGRIIVYTGLGGALLLLNYLILSKKVKNRRKLERQPGEFRTGHMAHLT
ncbi:MAG: HXXEE domain-containing protein [Candidatus Aminicenantes bacterium]|jgi:hypothetical protein